MTLAKKLYYIIFYNVYGVTKYLPMLSGDFFRYLVLKLFLRKIEGWVSVRDNVTFWFPEGISIGEDHGFSSRKIKIRDQRKTFQKIVIQDGCWIGCGVRILKGVIIGKGAIIGAGSVVTKNLPPFSISAGVPARVIGMRPRG